MKNISRKNIFLLPLQEDKCKYFSEMTRSISWINRKKKKHPVAVLTNMKPGRRTDTKI